MPGRTFLQKKCTWKGSCSLGKALLTRPILCTSFLPRNLCQFQPRHLRGKYVVPEATWKPQPAVASRFGLIKPCNVPVDSIPSLAESTSEILTGT